MLRGEVVIEVSKAGQTRRRTGLLRGVLLRHSVHSWIDNFLAPRKLGCVAHIEQLESLVSEKSLKPLMLQGVTGKDGGADVYPNSWCLTTKEITAMVVSTGSKTSQSRRRQKCFGTGIAYRVSRIATGQDDEYMAGAHCRHLRPGIRRDSSRRLV